MKSELESLLKPFFTQYESLVALADSIFERMQADHADCVNCAIGCADCCHALFDLTLIEALYLNHHFDRTYSGPQKDNLLETANRADRKVYQIKRRIHRQLQNGAAESELLKAAAQERVRCPLLDENSRCRLYAHRPITCRLYGIPASIKGVGHTCGRSGFSKGTAYPTVNLDTVHRRLFEISADLVRKLASRNYKIAEMLVPVSMALATNYDENYLGLGSSEDSRAAEAEERG